MVLTLVTLAAFVIVALRGVFSAVSLSGELDEALFNTTTPRLEKTKIDEALDLVNNRTFIPLDL